MRSGLVNGVIASVLPQSAETLGSCRSLAGFLATYYKCSQMGEDNGCRLVALAARDFVVSRSNFRLDRLRRQLCACIILRAGETGLT